MKHTTSIDTIGIRIDFNKDTDQRELLHELLHFISNDKTVYISDQSTEMMNGYNLFWNGTTIAVIRTGSYRSGSYLTKYETKFYINISFAGLKRHDDILDNLSYSVLVKICAFLNTKGVSFSLTELDIAIDMKCKFENVLVVCTRKSPKTVYNDLADRQAFDSTAYIERMMSSKLKTAVLRAYSYDKALKENLGYDLTRFELKLQSKYFNAHGCSIDSIAKALDRYHVMYYEDIDEINAKVAAYNSYAVVKKREIERMKFDDYRIYPDIQYIADFLEYIRTITFPKR